MVLSRGEMGWGKGDEYGHYSSYYDLTGFLLSRHAW